MENKESKVVQLIGIMYHGALSATGWSWTRLNGCLRSTLSSAIIAGMKFELDDIGNVYKNFKGGFWFGDRGWEWYYATAVGVANTSVVEIDGESKTVVECCGNRGARDRYEGAMALGRAIEGNADFVEKHKGCRPKEKQNENTSK